MFFIGIDISKFKHDCAVIDDFGDTVTPSWSFSNNAEGFSLLKHLLDSLEGEKRIGFEAHRSLWAKSKAVSRIQRLYLHGVSSASDLQICSQQISQKHENRFH